ncbi:hypothetical protein QJ856_gp0757 [Tupanvirus deep ocean]|uniref:Uncharacterized protein n=2 Tax=Tupanvirus TaxID=2094720 RepID=A0AC62A893_9VIRU|nr:hypothetical protein QJ856_gp0757 [Tupanvirus deep ocean]QKU33995.1 hypothetical protein [Tupanvirus deep ocean]
MEQHGIRYFISGHTDITQEQFDYHYKNKIITATKNPKNTFVMGSAPGADFMAQKLLIKLLENQPRGLDRITVYHKGSRPEKIADPRIKTIGGFVSHDEKDARMTQESDIDIAYVRTSEESKQLYGSKYKPDRVSGTQKNIERRMLHNCTKY